MDIRTGEILPMDEVVRKPFKERKYWKEIPKQFVEQMECMNRAERRKFYKRNKKEFGVGLLKEKP